MNTPPTCLPPVKLLLDGADSAEIAALVRQVVHLDMGLSNFSEERNPQICPGASAARLADIGDQFTEKLRDDGIVVWTLGRSKQSPPSRTMLVTLRVPNLLPTLICASEAPDSWRRKPAYCRQCGAGG